MDCVCCHSHKLLQLTFSDMNHDRVRTVRRFPVPHEQQETLRSDAFTTTTQKYPRCPGEGWCSRQTGCHVLMQRSRVSVYCTLTLPLTPKTLLTSALMLSVIVASYDVIV